MIPNLKDHRIVVTGARGIIGLPLCQCLSKAGATVVGIARRESAGLDEDISRACQAGPVSIVIHLAGQSDANQCELDPALALEQNTKLTASVLDACVKEKIPRLIFPSTGYVYGTDYKEKIKEDFTVHPGSIYTLTKLSSEMIIQYYADRGRINADILRISNVYGPQSKPNTVIGKMMNQAQDHGRIALRSLTPVRDFIYIDDVIEVLVRLVASPRKGCQVLNLSMGQAFSVGELAQLFCEVWGLPKESIECRKDPKEAPSALVLDNQILFERIGWRPSITLKDGLKRILKIQKENKIHAKT